MCCVVGAAHSSGTAVPKAGASYMSTSPLDACGLRDDEPTGSFGSSTPSGSLGCGHRRAPAGLCASENAATASKGADEFAASRDEGVDYVKCFGGRADKDSWLHFRS